MMPDDRGYLRVMRSLPFAGCHRRGCLTFNRQIKGAMSWSGLSTRAVLSPADDDWSPHTAPARGGLAAG